MLLKRAHYSRIDLNKHCFDCKTEEIYWGFFFNGRKWRKRNDFKDCWNDKHISLLVGNCFWKHQKRWRYSFEKIADFNVPKTLIRRQIYRTHHRWTITLFWWSLAFELPWFLLKILHWGRRWPRRNSQPNWRTRRRKLIIIQEYKSY